jgi:hypothetical protein
MFCDRCGTTLDDSFGFCPRCGKSLASVPLMPVQSRLAGHIRLLGILWLALSAFSLVPGVALLTFFGHHAPFFMAPPFLGGLMRLFGFAFIAGGLLGLIAGWGLLDRQPWARTLAIVLGILRLLDMPFGTALGIYTLWVLLPASSEREYHRMAKVA